MRTEQDVTGKAALLLKGTILGGLPLGFKVDRLQEPHTGGSELDVALRWPLTGLLVWGSVLVV